MTPTHLSKLEALCAASGVFFELRELVLALGALATPQGDMLTIQTTRQALTKQLGTSDRTLTSRRQHIERLELPWLTFLPCNRGWRAVMRLDWKQTGSGEEADWQQTRSRLEADWKLSSSGVEADRQQTGSGVEADWQEEPGEPRAHAESCTHTRPQASDLKNYPTDNLVEGEDARDAQPATATTSTPETALDDLSSWIADQFGAARYMRPSPFVARAIAEQVTAALTEEQRRAYVIDKLADLRSRSITQGAAERALRVDCHTWTPPGAALPRTTPARAPEAKTRTPQDEPPHPAYAGLPPKPPGFTWAYWGALHGVDQRLLRPGAQPDAEEVPQ